MIFRILGCVLALGVGAAGGYFGYKKTLTDKAIKFKEKMEKARELEEEMLEKAQEKVDKIIENAEKKAQRMEENKQVELDKRMQKLEQLESGLVKREEKMDERLDKLEQEKEKIADKKKEAQELIEEQAKILEKIAKLSREDAKQELLNHVEEEYQKDIKDFIEKFKTIKKEEADKEAAQILAKSLPRVAVDNLSEFTVVSVDIPDENFKGKLIGREGRNINYFEKVTGCELIIDDTPLLVRVSSFDHEKRFIATETLKKMIKDAKINPFHIQKIYDETVKGMDEMLLNKGKEALSLLNLPMMKPELVKMIGQFNLRYSYGQNLRQHSLEVAKVCEAIATEIGVDPLLAKKAWLLHDIGKISATTGQSHAKIGADVLRKFSVDPIIINAAESHHYDVPMTHPISWIVTAADAISASRPGARFNTKELFIEKMTELEKLITDITGVQKVYIMQAGREIMVYANPENIKDKDLEPLLKQIGTKIEEQLDYPGIIRVVGIRETKIVEYLK